MNITLQPLSVGQARVQLPMSVSDNGRFGKL
jgi:hypothetical protein